LERLSGLLSSQLEPEGSERLGQSTAGDPAIAGYCSNKFTTATRPIVLALIEQGNNDGSWDCRYPEETATFILQGLSGFFKQAPPAGDYADVKPALADIVGRLLGLPPTTPEH
jgi:hypothetical protein